jgi:hypothetical protein
LVSHSEARQAQDEQCAGYESGANRDDGVAIGPGAVEHQVHQERDFDRMIEMINSTSEIAERDQRAATLKYS